MPKASPQRVMLAIVAALTMTALCGCGSHDNADPEPDPQPPAGQVAGQVLYFTTGQGLGGVNLTVGGRTATSDNTGDFLITGIPPIDGQVEQQLTVDPPDWLTLPSSTPIYVDVIVDQTTVLAQPITLIDAGSGPPDPPS